MKLGRSVRAALTPFVLVLTAAVVQTHASGQSAQPAAGVTYFVAGGQHYLSYLDPAGQEFYIAVNAPAAAAAGPVTTKAVPISLAAGTPLKIRLATTLDSGKAKAGEIFEASIDHDLVTGGQIVAPKGSRVQGRVSEARGAGAKTAPLLALQLTGISSGGRIVPISSPVLKAESLCCLCCLL